MILVSPPLPAASQQLIADLRAECVAGNAGKVLGVDTDGSPVAIAAATALPLGHRIDPLGGVVTATYPGALEWERDPQVPSRIILLASRTWRAVADAVTNPPPGWTWRNEANALSAVASGGKLTIAGVTTGTYDWWGGTYTAPGFYRDYEAASGTRRIVCRLGSQDGNADYEGAALMVHLPGASGTGVVVQLGFNAPSVKYCTIGGTQDTVGITLGQQQAGVWLMIEQEGENFVGWYSIAASRPTKYSEWTQFATVRAPGGMARVPLRVNVVSTFRVGAPSAAVDGWNNYFDDREFGPSLLPSPIMSAVSGAPLCCGYHATRASTAFPLILARNIGTATINETATRARLVDAINKRGYDSATVNVALLRGAAATDVDDVPADGAASWATPAAVSVTGSGAYCSLYIRAASDGTQAASVDEAIAGIELA